MLWMRKYHQLIQFGLTSCLKVKTMKSIRKKLSLHINFTQKPKPATWNRLLIDLASCKHWLDFLDHSYNSPWSNFWQTICLTTHCMDALRKNSFPMIRFHLVVQKLDKFWKQIIRELVLKNITFLFTIILVVLNTSVP